MLIVDQSYSGQTLELPIGQVIELRLAENPTTGYRWTFLAQGEPSCAVVNERFENLAGPPGRGGEHFWQIKSIRVGECDIALQYRRSFQQDTPGNSFALHVRVTQ